MYFKTRDLDGSDIEKSINVTKKTKYDVMKEFANCIFCTSGIFIIFLSIGIGLLWGVYIPSQNDENYIHAKCKIYNNTINTVCPGNICEYSLIIDVKYNGKTHTAREKFTISEKSFADAEHDRTGKYAIGQDVTCYYSKSHHSLHLSVAKLSGNTTAGIFMVISFIVSIIVMLIIGIIIVMCIAEMCR